MNASATTNAIDAGVGHVTEGDPERNERPTPAEAVSSPADADPARLKEITTQLGEDMRPLVERLHAVLGRARPLLERARPWADVFLPIVDEMRPLMDDLRPVVHDLRALFGELLVRARGAVRLLAARLDLGPVKSVRRIVDAGARRLASIRPTPRVARPHPSLPLTIRAPRGAPVIRLPSAGPRIAAAVRSLAARLRPGRWAFRVVAVGIIAAVLSNSSLRDAMVEEVIWTSSVLQTVELPTIELPSLEMPTLQLPTIEIPALQLPTIEIPALQNPRQESASPSKLTPPQFELPPLNAYRAEFQSQASYPTVSPNATVEWVVALRNTGTVGWYRGVAGAQASLALTDGTEAAVQTTAYVAPGQVGWFVARFRAPAGPGTHAVALFPRIDGRGELPDLGIFTLVTVR